MSIELTVRFETITCCYEDCGITFAVPRWWEITRREDHSSWYCPNGHKQHFFKESDAERAERLRLQAQAEANEARHLAEVAKRQLAAARGQNTKMKRRAANGVCICCNRTFKDLANHMATKHPDFQVEAGVLRKQIEGAA